MKKYIFWLVGLFVNFLQLGYANNIQVSNVTLVNQNVTAGVNNAANFTYIEFDLTWENSWRTLAAPGNWDAAWVFIKYRTTGSSAWNHVRLAPSGHNTSPTTPTTSYNVQVGLVDESVAHNATTNPAVGAFIYRSGNGTGTFSANDIRLKWFYRDNGVGDNDIIDIEVYAIEMVYVPDGSFWLGNNGLNTNTPFGLYAYGTPSTSFQVTSESAFSGQGPSALVPGNLTFSEWGGNGTVYTIPAAFPKGFNGYYCMKYEGSQQNWVDFLNTSTSSQQANLSQSGGPRNGISVASGVFSTTLPFVAKHYNNWPDLAAYLDWAGLRLMTEFEYEKACRGPAAPVTDEFAWGNTNLFNFSGTLTNAGTANEISATAANNCVLAHNNTSNPLAQMRSGAFARAATTRTDAGASYYGIMDLTGNGIETVAWLTNGNGVSISNYTGLHGNGSITPTGYADVTNWPGLTAGNITATGSLVGVRGGSWIDVDPFNVPIDVSYGRVANRALHPLGVSSVSRDDWYNKAKSIRGVHTKPISSAETK
jgi:formylglycine-generating enzyme required for sulfatase activity